MDHQEEKIVLNTEDTLLWLSSLHSPLKLHMKINCQREDGAEAERSYCYKLICI